MAQETSHYLALLRGINVGGNNLIPQQALRECFEALGFSSVRTYIQSGNVLFRAGETGVRQLTERIEQGLSNRFAYDAQVVVLSQPQYAAMIQTAPQAWGKNDLQNHHAVFLLGDIEPQQVVAQLPAPKEDIETVTPGAGLIFWSVSKADVTKTTYAKLPAAPVYKRLTIRNHNTVLKLLELFETPPH